jgi:hypothetical protein
MMIIGGILVLPACWVPILSGTFTSHLRVLRAGEAVEVRLGENDAVQ